MYKIINRHFIAFLSGLLYDQDMDQKKEGKKISVTHVNVRMSISFLVLKLIMADLLTVIVIMLIYSGLIPLGMVSNNTFVTPVMALISFILLSLIETMITIYIVLRWLSEYYEISPYAVSYHRGVIFKKQDRYAAQNIKQVKIEQGIVGRILNYGTLVLFDWRLNKTAEMYAVHNPHRYIKILEGLLPNVDEHKSTIREHIIEREEE